MSRAGGLGWGDGPVALALTFAIIALVAYLAATRKDVQVADGAAYDSDEGALLVERASERAADSRPPRAVRRRL